MMNLLLCLPDFTNVEEDPTKVVVDWLASSSLLMIGLFVMCTLIDVPWTFLYAKKPRSFLYWILCFASIFIMSVLTASHICLMLSAIIFHQFGVLLVGVLGRLLGLVPFYFSKEKTRIKPIESGVIWFPSLFAWSFLLSGFRAHYDFFYRF